MEKWPAWQRSALSKCFSSCYLSVSNCHKLHYSSPLSLHHTCSLSAHQQTSRSVPAINQSIKATTLTCTCRYTVFVNWDCPAWSCLKFGEFSFCLTLFCLWLEVLRPMWNSHARVLGSLLWFTVRSTNTGVWCWAKPLIPQIVLQYRSIFFLGSLHCICYTCRSL